MPLETFRGCWDRLVRAKAHNETFAAISREFAASADPYRIVTEIDDDGTGRIWLIPNDMLSIPGDLAFELGEMLYQLRAALDGCVYAAAVEQSGQNPPPDEDRLEFPICATADDFKKARWKIRPLSDERQTFIEAVQPYNARLGNDLDARLRNINRALSILNDWARKDRHRKLHVVRLYAPATQTRIYVPAGCKVEHIEASGAGLLGEERSVVATFKLSGFIRGMQVIANTNFTAQVALDEPPPRIHPTADNLENRARAMLVATEVILTMMESSFEQTPWPPAL